jgi:hypothetical protein
MSAAFDIATKIATLTSFVVGTTLGVNTFIDAGDNEAAVFQFAGLPATRAHADTIQVEHPAIQLQVRNSDPKQAHDLCWSTFLLLRSLKDQTINTHFYHWIRDKQEPHQLGKDESGRVTYMCEFEVSRRPE